MGQHEVLIFTIHFAYAQKPPINACADNFSNARGLNFGPGLHQHLYFMHGSRKSSHKSVHLHMIAKALLVYNVASTKISCAGLYIMSNFFLSANSCK